MENPKKGKARLGAQFKYQKMRDYDDLMDSGINKTALFFLGAALFLIMGCVNIESIIEEMDKDVDSAVNVFIDTGDGQANDGGSSGGTGTGDSGGIGTGTPGGTGDGGATGTGGSPGAGGATGGSPGATGGAGDGTGGSGEETPAMSKEQARQYIQMLLSVPNPPLQTLVAALEVAQLAGLEEEEDKIYADLLVVVAAAIDNTLNNPTASIRELLEAAELSQKWGVGDEEIMDKVVPRIKPILQARLADSHFCRRQLLALAGVAQTFGINDIAEQAQAKAASDNCVDISYLYTYNSNDTQETHEATVTGYFEELAPLGLVEPQARPYALKDGKMVWSYNFVKTERCEITTMKGNGNEELSEADAQLFIKPNGEYSFAIFKYSTIDVSVTATGNPDCEDVQTGTSTQEMNIGFGFDGTTQNPNYIDDEKNEEEGGESTKIKWT